MLADLRAESDDLDAVIASATDDDLARATPAEGWSVSDTLGHLWFFDREGRRALEDPDDFTSRLETLFADPEGYMRQHVETIRELGEELVPSWHDERRRI